MKTIKRSELSNLKMSTGKNKPQIVICDGYVKEWVGIGWIDLRKATKADEKKYPKAVE